MWVDKTRPQARTEIGLVPGQVVRPVRGPGQVSRPIRGLGDVPLHCNDNLRRGTGLVRSLGNTMFSDSECDPESDSSLGRVIGIIHSRTVHMVSWNAGNRQQKIPLKNFSSIFMLNFKHTGKSGLGWDTSRQQWVWTRKIFKIRKHLIDMKGVQCEDFHHASLDTKEVIAETTGTGSWAADWSLSMPKWPSLIPDLVSTRKPGSPMTPSLWVQWHHHLEWPWKIQVKVTKLSEVCVISLLISRKGG